METKNWKETLLAMSRRIDEDRAFLQSYMLDPCLDNRPAEEERLKISSLLPMRWRRS